MTARAHRVRHQPPRTARVEARRSERREALLDAAMQAIRTLGSRVSMDELAAAGGVTKPILYRHFGDRRGLVAALAERFAAELQATLQGSLDAPTGNLEAVIHATIDAFVGFVERDTELYHFLVQRLAAGDEGTGPTLSTLPRRLGDQLAVPIGEELRRSGRDSGAAEPVAHGIVGFVQSAGDWWLDRRVMSRARVVDYLTEFVVHGLVGIGVPNTRPIEEGSS